MRRVPLTRALPIALGGLTCATVVAALAIDGAAPPPAQAPGATSAPRFSPVAFRTFGDCTALLAYYREHAAKLVGPYGLPGAGYGVRELAVADSARAAAGAAPVPSAKDTTGTNVQVAGVDEADLVKVTGDRLVTVSEGRVQVLRIGSGPARHLGSLRLPDSPGAGQSQLLVQGSSALVITTGFGGPVPLPSAAIDSAVMVPGTSSSTLTEVDLADPAQPRLVRSLRVDGEIVGARLNGGTVRLAISSSPQRLRWRLPDAAGDEKSATAANRRVARTAPLGRWLPQYTLTGYDVDGTEAVVRRGQLLDCADIAAPRRFSGLDTLSMLSLDLRGGRPGVSAWSGAGVVASGSTLYATADRAYVSTSPWDSWSAGPDLMTRAGAARTTQVHLFDTPPATGDSPPPAPLYVASGEVRGSLLNQFAMDEHDGVLRVASTTGDDASAATQSRVTVLRPDGERLRAVGTVTGLGRGERIRGVRFAGSVGYVVTFRQTDPLYTLDLSDPAAPRAAGELKVLGYSAYLHPLGDGLLLGVGQDGDSAGRLRGLQMSLFDVSDPAAPRRLDRVPLPGAWSDVEGDHHAFTMAGGTALVPFQLWRGGGVTEPSGDGSAASVATFDAGVLAVGVQGRTLGPARVLRPVADGPVRIGTAGVQPDVQAATPLRTVVLGGNVYTVTPVGIAAHGATTGTRLGFTRF